MYIVAERIRILDPNPEKEIINVQPGSLVPVSFITLEASEEPPLRKNLNAYPLVSVSEAKSGNIELCRSRLRSYQPGVLCKPNRGMLSLTLRYFKFARRILDLGAMDLYRLRAQ
jgi:hypothetical protein